MLVTTLQRKVTFQLLKRYKYSWLNRSRRDRIQNEAKRFVYRNLSAIFMFQTLADRQFRNFQSFSVAIRH